MRPELIHIGDFTLYSFGLMAALALIVPGLAVVYPLLRRRGAAADFAFELIFAGGIGGFVGARVYYIAEHWSALSDDLWGALTSGYGFTWYGGLIGGFVGVTLWTLIRRVPLGIVANTMGPAVALGYTIGRIGCQLAGDGDYGKPSDLPWAMGYPNGTVPTDPGVTVHPTPIYEILIMTPIIWLLWRLANKDRSGWWTFGWMLVLTGVERFVVEFVRRNEEVALGLTQPQWVAIASVVIGTTLVLLFRKKPAERVAARRGARA